MTQQTVSINDVWQAAVRIKRHILRTPLLYSPALSQSVGCEVYLKMECWQLCGCFKVRGAINFVSSLTAEERMRGLVTASSGNHGIAVAYAAQVFGGSEVIVYLPEGADPARLEKIHLQGARTIMHGSCFAEAYQAARIHCDENGKIFVHSHADPRIIAGQGTIGMEILEDLPDADVIVAPIGGGGLIAGITLAVKAIRPETRLIGVEPAAAPSAFLSMQDGICRETIDVRPSMADGLLGGIGKLPFEIFASQLESVQLVEEDEMAQAMRLLQKDEQLMVEAAAATSLAALSAGKIAAMGQKVVLVITSRNIHPDRFNRVVTQNVREMVN